MQKHLIITAIFTLLSLSVAPTTLGQQYGQYGQYGVGGGAQPIIVDKLVAKPGAQTKGGLTELTYVDNLSANDMRFRAGQQVTFQIKVKNTSSTKQVNIVLSDTVPDFVEPIEGPGTYNPQSRVITANVPDLNPGEEKVYFLRTQVVSQDRLPTDKGLFCPVNRANVSSAIAGDQDTAQFCIEKEVTGVTQVPSAGPEMGALVLSGQFALLGLGYYIRRKVA